jgi:branched-chain amino acid transport system substrate-binding protein
VHEDLDDASPERGAWDPVLEATNADKAIRDPDVVAYIGPYNSGAAKISLPRLNQAGLAAVNGFATWPGLTKPGLGESNEPAVYRPSGQVTFFRVVPSDDIQGKVAAKWTSELGAKKVFVIHDRELYGKGIAEIYRKSVPKYAVQVVGFEGIDIKASNYRSLAIKVKQQDPDVVFYGGTTQSNAGQLAKDLRAVGVKAKLMVPDGCFEKAFIDSAGKANLDGSTYVTFGGVPPTMLTGKGKDFYERYKAVYKQEPEGYAAYGYEAASVILETLAKVGTKDRSAVIEGLRQVKNFEGVLGTWSFDANGDTTLTTMSGSIVRGDSFEFVKLLSALEGGVIPGTNP